MESDRSGRSALTDCVPLDNEALCSFSLRKTSFTASSFSKEETQEKDPGQTEKEEQQGAIY